MRERRRLRASLLGRDFGFGLNFQREGLVPFAVDQQIETVSFFVAIGSADDFVFTVLSCGENEKSGLFFLSGGHGVFLSVALPLSGMRPESQE